MNIPTRSAHRIATTLGTTLLRPSRRSVLIGLAQLFAAVGLVRPALALEGYAHAIQPPRLDTDGALRFFTPAEHAFVDAMAGRIVPADASGPGAREAGSAYFIDRRLARPDGGAEGWYMDGPFVSAPATMGWQAQITPAQLYRGAIAQMDAIAQARHKANFASLPETDQDGLIKALQNGDLDNQIKHAGMFFDIILTDVVAGLMADPVYGGNREFIGWKMIGHPGMRYDWRDWVSRDDPPPAGPMMGVYGPAEHYDALWGNKK